MKKSLLALGLGVTLATAAFAATSLEALNAEIARFLAPYQNAVTSAKLEFTDVQTDETKTLSFGVNGFYKKVGSVNFLDVIVDNISYNYNNGVDPTAKIKGALGLDLTKVLPQETINQLVPGLEEMASEIAKDFTKQYGDAITVDLVISDKTQDAAGNYVSIKAKVGASLDFSKLPSTINVADIMFKSGEATIELDVKKGIKLNGYVVMNVGYKGFQKDGQGMKQSLDALLNRDPKELKELEDIFQWLERAANGFVNGQQTLGL
jgi:hypothetical protein